MNFFKYLFKTQISLNRFTYRNNEYLKKIDTLCFLSLLLIGALGLCFDSIILLLIAFHLEIISLFISILKKLNTFATSLRSFLLYGFWIEIFISYITLFLIHKVLKLIDANENYIISYLFVLILLLIWLCLSLMINNNIAKIVNLTLATFFGILVYLKDFILLCLPDGNIEKYSFYGLSYTYKQSAEIIISVILTPFLITNVIATLLCEIKGYWIEKYNNGIDITIDLIKKNNSKDIHN